MSTLAKRALHFAAGKTSHCLAKANQYYRRSGVQPDRSAQPSRRRTERYRTAGWVLPRSPRGEWTCVLDPSGDDRKARSGKARSLRHTQSFQRNIRSLAALPGFSYHSVKREPSAISTVEG